MPTKSEGLSSVQLWVVMGFLFLQKKTSKGNSEEYDANIEWQEFVILNCKKMVPLFVTTPLPLNNPQNGWYVQCRELEIQNAAATFKPSTESNLEIANHVHQSMALDQNNYRYPETHIPFIIDEVGRKKKKKDVS